MNGIMAVSEESLDEFIEIYERVHGERLPHEEAREVATNLLNVYKLLLSSPEQASQTSPEGPPTLPAVPLHSPRRRHR
jgi:hypothetical protein